MNIKFWIKRSYAVFGILMFLLIMLPLFPFFVICFQSKKTIPLAYKLYQFWANTLFWSIGMFPKKIFKSKIDRTRNYIITPNHFSFLDVPLVGSGPLPVSFMGKAELAKVPLFGYIYKRFNVLVDRKDPQSRRKAMEQSKRFLDEGRSMVIFPEGTQSQIAPEMGKFKKGAFILAIEKQLPVIPVTILENWKILPGDNKFLMSWGVPTAIYHEPIETKGLNSEDVDALSERVKNIIDTELKKHYNNECK